MMVKQGETEQARERYIRRLTDDQQKKNVRSTIRPNDDLKVFGYIVTYESISIKGGFSGLFFFRKNRQLISNLMVTWRCIKLISWTRVLEDIVRKGM